MTTLSIHQRPAPFLAAAAALAAIAAGAIALSVSDDPGRPSTPGEQSQVSVHKDAPRTHFHYTTSGGRVMMGN